MQTLKMQIITSKSTDESWPQYEKNCFDEGIEFELVLYIMVSLVSLS